MFEEKLKLVSETKKIKKIKSYYRVIFSRTWKLLAFFNYLDGCRWLKITGGNNVDDDYGRCEEYDINSMLNLLYT